jgi:hypothetical protein
MPVVDVHRPWPDVHRVVAGDVAVDIAPEGLRHLTVRGREAAANLYAAVRARDWGTLPNVPVSAHLDVGGSSIALRRVETVGKLLRSVLEVSWAEPGILTATVTLTGLADAEINRWGFNVCLHAGDWAGAQLLNVPGQPRLPRDVAPQLAEGGVLKGLFPPLPRLDLRRLDRAVVRIASEGQLLEAEDQRNWTDPTFKIYSGSLGDPLPLAVRKGTVLRQTLRLVAERMPAAGGRADQHAVLGPVTALPFVGVQANDAGPPGRAGIAAAVAALGLDHVRVDTEHPDFTAPGPDAVGPPLSVELAVLVPEVGPDVLASVAQAAAQLPPRSRVLLHRTQRRTTDAAAAAELAGLLTARRPDIVVVPGTDAYFADLNRDRPRYDDFVSFSITPTVHAFDTESVFATLPVQAELIRQTRKTFAATAVISPITLRLRGDPEWPGAPASARRRVTERHIDQRLGGLEGAAWTLGSVHAVTQGGGYSGTWHELLGPRGLLRAGPDPAGVVPAFHALSVLQAWRRPRVRPVTMLDGGVVGLLFVDRPRLVLSSQRPWEQQVRLGAWAPPVRRRRRLRTEDLDAAAATMSWWDGTGQVEARHEVVTLEPYELTELSPKGD